MCPGDVWFDWHLLEFQENLLSYQENEKKNCDSHLNVVPKGNPISVSSQRTQSVSAATEPNQCQQPQNPISVSSHRILRRKKIFVYEIHCLYSGIGQEWTFLGCCTLPFRKQLATFWLIIAISKCRWLFSKGHCLTSHKTLSFRRVSSIG
jgi:hypothetical protein